MFPKLPLFQIKFSMDTSVVRHHKKKLKKWKDFHRGLNYELRIIIPYS